jgi:uncharacterized membrane protein YbhN (UPF0104 family)
LARLAGGAAIIAALVWRVGAGPFADGLREVSAGSIAAACAIGLVTTVCCAWRWSVVARGLGVPVALRPAIAAYYRSQFLNTALPAGVLGDVHRGVQHGRDAGEMGRALRAVAWDRTSGQVVQAVLAVAVLAVLPSPVQGVLPIALAGAALLGLLVVAVLRIVPGGGSTRSARVRRAVRADVRDGLLARRAWPTVVAASVLVVAGHASTFLIAARTAGSGASLARLLPIAMVVLLAMAVPTNIGGWGPREGASAWLFGAAGLGADQGLATATVYGVLAIAASLPGLAVLAIGWLRRAERSRAVRSGAQTGARGEDSPATIGGAAGAPMPNSAPRPASTGDRREGALHG